MKYLFALVFIALAAASVATHLTAPDVTSEVPVIYWVIDPAPVRAEQIAAFHRWLIENGHGERYTLNTMDELRTFRARRWSPALRRAITEANPDGPRVWDPATSPADLPLTVRVPLVEMRHDPANNDLGKKVIQGVSGVGGDVIEAYHGGAQMRFLVSANLLADVTDLARKYDFGPDQTWPALRASLFVDGRQYAFPRNPAQTLYWVNRETFSRYGQELPPARWTIEEFEQRGRAFVAAANPPDERQTVFFADRACREELRRSVGVSLLNETLTASALDDPYGLASGCDVLMMR